MSQENKTSPLMTNSSSADTSRPGSCDNGVKSIDSTNERLVGRRPERHIYRPDKIRKDVPPKQRQNDRSIGNDYYNDHRVNTSRINSINSNIRSSPIHSNFGEYRNPHSHNFRSGLEASINRAHSGPNNQSSNPVPNINSRYNPNKSTNINSISRSNISSVDANRDTHQHQQHQSQQQSQYQNSFRNDHMQPIDEHSRSLTHSKSRTETRIFSSRSLNPQAPQTPNETKDQPSNPNNVTSSSHPVSPNQDGVNKSQYSHQIGSTKTNKNWNRPSGSIQHQHKNDDHEITTDYSKVDSVSTIAGSTANDKLGESKSKVGEMNSENRSTTPNLIAPQNQSTNPQDEARSQQIDSNSESTEAVNNQITNELEQPRVLRSGATLGPASSGSSQQCEGSSEKLTVNHYPLEANHTTRQIANLSDSGRNQSRDTKLSGDREHDDWRKNSNDDFDSRQQQRDSSYNRKNISNRDVRNYSRETKYQPQVAPRFRRMQDQGDRNAHSLRPTSRNNDIQNRRSHNGGRAEHFSDGYTNQPSERQTSNNGIISNAYGFSSSRQHKANNPSLANQNYLNHQIRDNVYSSSRSSSVGSNEHLQKQSIDRKDSAQETTCDISIDDILNEIKQLQNNFNSCFAPNGSYVTVNKAHIFHRFTTIESACEKLFALPSSHLDSNFNQLENLWTNIHFRIIHSYQERFKVSPTFSYKSELIESIDHVCIYYENLLVNLLRKLDMTLEDITFHRLEDSNESVHNLEISRRYINFIHLCLGDLWSTKEQVTRTDTVKSRAYYIKAQQIDPYMSETYKKLSQSFQLIERKFDAVYFHMRYLATFNESHDHEKLHQLMCKVTQNLNRDTEDYPDEKQLDDLSLIDLNKLFNCKFLSIYSKLFDKSTSPSTKSINQMLLQFRCLLKKSPTSFSSQRLLQLISMNMYAALYCSSQESMTNEELAMELIFTMITMIIEASNNCLYDYIQSKEFHESRLPRDLHEFLPAVKLWADWISRPDRIKLADQILSSEIGICHTKPGHWPAYLADLYNLLDIFDVTNDVCKNSDKNRSLVWLHEEIHFIGFPPLDSVLKNKFYCNTSKLNEKFKNNLRIQKLRSLIRNFQNDSNQSVTLFKLDDVTGTLKSIKDLCEAHPSVVKPIVRSEESVYNSIRKRVLDNKSKIDAKNDVVGSSHQGIEEESSWVRLEMEAKLAKDEALNRPAIQNEC